MQASSEPTLPLAALQLPGGSRLRDRHPHPEAAQEVKVEPGRRSVLAEFGFVVMGWWRERDIELSGSFETWAAAEEYLRLVRQRGLIAWAARAEDDTRAEVIDGEEVVDKRIYVVTVNGGEVNSLHLVRAGNPAQAIRHVAKGMVSAHVAKQEEILTHRGVEVEDAGDGA